MSIEHTPKDWAKLFSRKHFCNRLCFMEKIRGLTAATPRFLNGILQCSTTSTMFENHKFDRSELEWWMPVIT